MQISRCEQASRFLAQVIAWAPAKEPRFEETHD